MFADAHRLSTRARCELIAEVCDAVQHAHGRGVIHRDLKPGNILVALGENGPEDAQSKILDFGIARTTSPDLPMTAMLTLTGQVLGTLSYMSPEQRRWRSGSGRCAHRRVLPRCDSLPTPRRQAAATI